MEFDFQMERSGFRPAINALGDMPVCVVARDGTIQSFNRAIWETTALLLAPVLTRTIEKRNITIKSQMSAKQLKVFHAFTTYFLVAEGSQPKDPSRDPIKSVKSVWEVTGNEDVFSICPNKPMMNQIVLNNESSEVTNQEVLDFLMGSASQGDKVPVSKYRKITPKLALPDEEPLSVKQISWDGNQFKETLSSPVQSCTAAMSIIETTTSVIKTEPAEDTSIDSTEPPETKEEDTDGVTVKQEPIEEEDFQPSNTSNHSERVEVQVKVDPDSVVVDQSKPSRRKRKQVMNETRTELEQEESNAQELHEQEMCKMITEEMNEKLMNKEPGSLLASGCISVQSMNVCLGCGYRFRTEKLLIKHQEFKRHNNSCPLCEDKLPGFKTWSEHLAHINQLHDGVQPFRCTSEDCDRILGSSIALKDHLSSNHPDQVPIPIKKAPLKGRPPESKTDYFKSHNYKCEQCEGTYATYTGLSKHVLLTHGGQVQCEFCGEKVPEVRYNKHVLTFHKSGSEKPYQCHVCQKGFLESNHLKEHMNIHEGIKPFKCTLGCVDVAYASHGTLAAHIRSFHQGKKRKYKKRDKSKAV